ncbi:MAG: ImuA protein [Pseudorhodoplanes sp.]|jgi:protein ImuA|nr:ImuA protein [Pseudorhodoplanes sp.]
MPRQEGISASGRVLPLGPPELDVFLPQGGLSLAAVHEILPRAATDAPAACGFIIALLGRLVRAGSTFFVASRGEIFSTLHGHGLNGLGLDPARVILVETDGGKQALWAIEETLRSGVPGAVAGLVDSNLDLLAGQRLHLAAADSGIPLFLLRPPDQPGTNVAATRWRVATAPGTRDRFGLATHWRWHLRLERCRNGRTGEWLVEFDHAAYRFSLPAAMAHPAFSCRAGAQSVA